MARGDAGGRVRRSAVPKLRLVDGETELVADPANTSATRLLSPKAPEAPDDLPEAGRALWDQLVAELDGAGLLAACDQPTLHLAVRAYLHALDASDTLLSEGPLSTGSMGQPVANPAGQAFRSHAATFMDYARALGLSLASRARITVPAPAPDALDAGNPFRGPATSA